MYSSQRHIKATKGLDIPLKLITNPHHTSFICQPIAFGPLSLIPNWWLSSGGFTYLSYQVGSFRDSKREEDLYLKINALKICRNGKQDWQMVKHFFWKCKTKKKKREKERKAASFKGFVQYWIWGSVIVRISTYLLSRMIRVCTAVINVIQKKRNSKIDKKLGSLWVLWWSKRKHAKATSTRRIVIRLPTNKKEI